MEKTKSLEIIDIIQEIIEIIETTNMHGANYFWHSYFTNKMNILKGPHDINKFSHNMLKIFGGMGSFNDYSVCENFKPLPGDDRLYELRSELFEALNE